MANKLDQLFRENLDQLEMRPSAEGWDRVQDRLAGKKKGAWILSVKIAAAAVVVITASVVVSNLDEGKKQPLVSGVDHPVINQEREWRFDIPMESSDSKKPVRKQPQSLMMAMQKAEQKNGKDGVILKEIPVLSIAALDKPILEVDLAPRNIQIMGGKVEPEKPFIKITYIASGKGPVSEDVKNEGKISKVLAVAKEVSPTDLLADIRDAKDNLFRRNN